MWTKIYVVHRPQTIGDDEDHSSENNEPAIGMVEHVQLRVAIQEWI